MMMTDVAGDMEEEGEEVYTVIPTAPEDMMFDSSFDTSSPRPTIQRQQQQQHRQGNKKIPHLPSMVQSASPNNGSSHHHHAPSNANRTNHNAKPRESTKRKDGLPSHAFSRNYYCRFCSFNTTKSKVHLYHLVDVHGVDYKIFSCDKCDYASRWKCKVIRHRKMIHKINEPKFEPEMHDSRGQTGKRPPPAQQTVQQSSHLPSGADNRASFHNAAVAQSDPLPSNQQLPSFIQPFTQSPHLAGHPINPFVKQFTPLNNNLASEFAKSISNEYMMKEEKSSHPSATNAVRAPLTDNVSRRKQRKPQNVRKVIQDGEEEMYEAIKSEIDKQDNEASRIGPNREETNSMDQADEPEPLFALFGGLDDSGSSGAGGILSGPSWRRRLMPTAVTMTTGSTPGEKTSSEEQQVFSKILQNNNTIGTNLKPSLSQMSVTSSHSNSSLTETGQYGDDNSLDEQTLIKEKCVEEITIDDEPHYRCTECNFISKFRWKTSKHYKSNHNSAKLFKCTVCHYSTINRVDFFSHKATHSSRGMHKCEECAYIASSKTNLDRHMVNHRQSNPVKCLYCSFSSTGEAAIQRHMAEHHDQSELPITMRKPTSDLEDSQDEGMVNGDGEFNCELCGYTARNWSKMKEHMIRHSEGTPFACSYCDSKYKRPADLNRHLKIKHNTCLADIGLDGPTLKGVMEPSFQGAVLDDPMAAGDGPNLASLKRIYQSEVNQEGDSDGDEPKRLCIDEEGGNLQCTKCSYVAKWKSDLERHMKVHSEEKRFGCPVCFKSYKYQGDLNVHMRKSHAAGHIRSPKQGSGQTNMPSSMRKTPPPNVQVISNEVIVNMSHAAIVNPLANLGPAMFSVGNQKPSGDQQYQLPQLTSAPPQMPMLKPAPTVKSSPANAKERNTSSKDVVIKLNSDGKPIKKGELDPSTMIHVPGGEFKCLNCCYETNFKSHLDAHMRLHPEKPFHCKFCNYASYWRGDTKKHIEKNHPEQLPEGVNPYNLVEQVFEEAVRSSSQRHKPLPEVHNTPAKPDMKSDKGMIWTPPNEDAVTVATPLATRPEQLIIPTPPRQSASPSQKSSGRAKGSNEDGPTHVQCPHCNYNTTSESRLNAHMATHYNLKIFKCPDCGKRANWKWDIQKHMRTDHPDCSGEVIVLDTEEAKDSLDEYLKQHPEQRGKPKIGVSADYRPEHWPKPRDMTSSSKATSIRPFRCSICGRRSNWKCDIRKHYRQVHPGRVDAIVELMTREELIEAGEKEDDVEQHYPEMKNSKGANSIRPYKCSLCVKNSRWKWDISKHIKMVHKGNADAHVIEDEEALEMLDSDPGTPDTSITDGEGDNSLIHSPSSVKKDRASPDPTPRPAGKHTNSPKIGCYQCSICSQFSEFMWVIRRHIRSLHPDNPDAKIVDLSTKGEEANHSDSRPYICSLCGKRSNWKWDVKKHILSVHRGTIGSILDEQLNKETVIYADGKTMEVDDGKTKQKIADIQTHLKEDGTVPLAALPPPAPITSSSSVNNSCYSSLPTMVGLQSAVAPSPDPSSQGEWSNGGVESAKSSPTKADSDGVIKFKCGYCFFASASRNETVRHVRHKHDGKILRIQTLNKAARDEQTTYKAAHRTSSQHTVSMWQCSHCTFKHAKKEEALMHIAQHDLYNAYQCAICDFADDMEYTLHKHIKTKHDVENVENVLLQNIVFAASVDEPETTSTGVTYTCNQCEMKTAWRSAIVRHIKEKHVIESDIHSMFTKHGSNRFENSPGDQNRRYNCAICPYKTDKVSMYNEHADRHTQKNESDIKCQYCDYWVTANRLLHQHIKLHQQEQIATANSVVTNGSENSRDKCLVAGGLAQCPDCPYRGKTKDLNAHKKLHRQRPGAVYKCKECDYWVNHNRLLQQHAKVHSPRYRQKVFTSSFNFGDTSLDDVAVFKQHLISSQVTPVKLEAGDGPERLKRKLHTCIKCPFASNRIGKVEDHAVNHGAYTENALKCKFCDFYCESRELMAHHIKVHSLQYQGEFDEDESEMLLEKNGNAVSEDDEVSGGKIVESTAGFNLTYSDKEVTLERQKKGLASRKYCCEKCPYASALKENFQRHNSLHGSKQGFTCGFCNYGVPSAKLLRSHELLHQQPNRNLLATQSIMNLTKLKPIAADVQLAHTAELVNGSVTDVHDHLRLYENADPMDTENHSGTGALDDEGEPEFIDLAELGTKVTPRSSDNDDEMSIGSKNSIESGANGTSEMNGSGEEFEMEDGEEVWICRFCDRAFDSELDLTSHEKQHS